MAAGWPSAADLTARGIGGVTAVTARHWAAAAAAATRARSQPHGHCGWRRLAVVPSVCRLLRSTSRQGRPASLPVCDGCGRTASAAAPSGADGAIPRIGGDGGRSGGLALDADDDANTEADDDASTDADGGSGNDKCRSRNDKCCSSWLRQMLPPCRALIASERLSGSRPAALPLDDHAPRACDHCAREIFNRCSLILHSRTICQFPPSRTPWPKPCPVTAMPMPMYAKWHRWRAWSSPGRLPEHHDTPRPGVRLSRPMQPPPMCTDASLSADGALVDQSPLVRNPRRERPRAADEPADFCLVRLAARGPPCCTRPKRLAILLGPRAPPCCLSYRSFQHPTK